MTAPAPSETPEPVDPITLEIVANGLTAIADRITTRMIRSANSFIVKEMEDCSAALFDGEGRLLAESANIPIHLNCVGICLRTVLDHCIPLDQWRPGDVVMTNETYIAGGSMASAHTNDFIAFHPLFHDGRLVAFSGLMVHHMDIGATNMGTRGWGSEIYQEGFRLPPLKVVDEGRLDANLMAFMLNNTRVPETLENDLLSQISSVRAAGDEVRELFVKYGTATTQAACAALIAYAERRTRDEIARIPDGTYRHEEPVLDDGSMGGPYWLRLKLIKVGSDITFDFSGTDDQIRGPINAPLATTWSAVFYALRAVTDPTIPSTEGGKRPVRLIAPPGTLVNARKPAAVYQRMIVCHSIVDLVMGALAQAIPERVMGDSCGCLYNYAICEDPETGATRMFGEVAPGGLGATADADGIDVMSCNVTNCPVPPIEATEIESPALYLRREFREDSGGDGRWRGGVGQVLSYRILGDHPRLHHTSQKSHSLPQGVHGGLPGSGGRWVINEGTNREQTLEFDITDLEPLEPGDTVTHYTPAGGGYRPPREREPERVREDILDGFVSLEKAARVYGVVLDPETLEIVAVERGDADRIVEGEVP